MPRFDVFRNPNPRATHALLLDVQRAVLSASIGRVSRDDQLLVDSAIDFMLRGC